MEEAKPQILLWTLPEFAFRVTIPATLLNETRIHAVEAFYSVPRGGVEVGGVYFGIREPDVIHIQARRPIHCEYSTGPSFTLSISDQLGLSGLLDQAHSDPDLAGMMPLGWYHSHTRSNLFLSPVDLELYNEFFPEKWQVALVLKPANMQPTKAGFFFRDRSGNLKPDAPLQEFKLEPPDFGLAPFDSQDPIAVPLQIPAAAPSAALTGLPLPDPVDTPVIASAAVAESEPSTVPALVIKGETSSLLQESAPEAISDTAAVNGSGTIVAEAPAIVTPVVSATPAPESKLDPEIKPEPVEILLQGFGPAGTVPTEKRKEQRKTGWIWTLAMIVLILLSAFGGAAFFKWGKIGTPVGLGLEIYDINGAFLIRWDRLSSAIRDASGGTLEIEDGGEKSDPIELTPEELAVGGYGYMRRTDHVSVHMKVNGPQSLDEYRNFDGIQALGGALGSRPADSPGASNSLTQALGENQHLKTELINESMRSTELRREITSLRKQLAKERARDAADPPAR